MVFTRFSGRTDSQLHGRTHSKTERLRQWHSRFSVAEAYIINIICWRARCREAEYAVSAWWTTKRITEWMRRNVTVEFLYRRLMDGNCTAHHGSRPPTYMQVLCDAHTPDIAARVCFIPLVISAVRNNNDSSSSSSSNNTTIYRAPSHGESHYKGAVQSQLVVL